MSLPSTSPPPPQNPPQEDVPSFVPFFTLIAPPTSTSTHSHPRVHYIFADDTTEPVAPPNSRVLLLDIAPSGNSVSSARSLSSDFQIVGTSITPAPQWSASDGAAGLMLTIEGVEGNGLKGVKSSAGVEELAAAFDERMAMLERVVEFGGGMPSDLPYQLREQQKEQQIPTQENVLASSS